MNGLYSTGPATLLVSLLGLLLTVAGFVRNNISMLGHYIPLRFRLAFTIGLVLSLMIICTASARPQTTWAPIGRKPLSNRSAAARVTRMPELRPENAPTNNYYVTKSNLHYFRTVRNEAGQTSIEFNHWNAYVDGRSTLRHPSTDDLIQWAAHKWGIPEDWLRAQVALEANWQMDLGGDLTKVSDQWYKMYPPISHSTLGPNLVYESTGISQVLWVPDNFIGLGTRYLRYRSTAFQLDYMSAAIRFYYDGACQWCGPRYRKGNKWLSIAAWNSPYPWNNDKQRWYAREVRMRLAERVWEQPWFKDYRIHRP